MIQHQIFEGQLWDDFDECLPKLIDIAVKSNEDVFLRWNGATVRIRPDSTKESVTKDFDEQCHMMALWAKEHNGEILHIDKIANQIAQAIKKLAKANFKLAYAD